MSAALTLPPAPTPHTAYLRFELGAQSYALAIAAVREILNVVALTELPLMPRFVRGVMNLRGAVLPVIDLAARLALHDTVIQPRTCIVIVEVAAHGQTPGQTLGVLVDAVHEVVSCVPAQLQAVPSLGTAVAAHFLCAMARLDGHSLPVLDTARVLALDELADLIAHHRTH